MGRTDGVGEIAGVSGAAAAAIRVSGYPCSIRIRKVGPKSSCHLVLFMAYCHAMSAVCESGQMVKPSVQESFKNHWFLFH